MKKIKLLLLLIATFLFTTNVYATGGGLRRASIKTCPDGVTYGMHSDGHGGTHWHRAATNGENYYAVGDAIYYDPCPGNTVNNGTADSTHGGSNYSGSSNNNYNNSNNSDGNSSTYNATETPVVPPVVTKSDDATIKSITVNEKNIEVSDVMTFETEEDSVKINVTPNHSKASVKINRETTNLKKENKFEIVVTAEAGNTKTYILNVSKVPGLSMTTLTLKVNEADVPFNGGYYYNRTELFYVDKVKFTYTLSNSKSKIKILKDDKEIGDEDKLVLGENNYKFIITDEDGDFVEYTLTIDKINFQESILVLIVGFGFFIGFIFLIISLIKRPKKKGRG